MVVDARGSRARPADPGEAGPEPDVLRRHQVRDECVEGEVPAEGVRPPQPRPRQRRPAPAR